MSMRSDDSVLLEQEFSDASLDLIFAEFWGTFLLVFAVACGHIASGLNTAETTRLSVAVVSGQWFSSRSIFQVRSAGRISIRRLPMPALRGNFLWRQPVGICCGPARRRRRYPFAGLGATTPQRGVTFWQAFAVEAVLTVGLVNAILGSASGA